MPHCVMSTREGLSNPGVTGPLVGMDCGRGPHTLPNRPLEGAPGHVRYHLRPHAPSALDHGDHGWFIGSTSGVLLPRFVKWLPFLIGHGLYRLNAWVPGLPTHIGLVHFHNPI